MSEGAHKITTMLAKRSREKYIENLITPLTFVMIRVMS